MHLKTLLSILIVLSATAAAVAESVVVIAASGGAQFVPGAVYESGTVFDVPAGASVTLLAESGSTVRLNGPFKGVPRTAGAAEPREDQARWRTAFTKIAGLLAKDTERTGVISAAREVDPVIGDDQPDLWLMAVDGSGHRCIKPTNVWMWRSRPDAAMQFALRNEVARRTGLVWRAGRDRMELPPEFIKDGTLLVMRSGKPPRRFRIHVLPQTLAADRLGDVLLWMVDRGCETQARQAIGILARSR